MGDVAPTPTVDEPPPAHSAPLRDSALGALGIAAPILARPAFLWAPTVLTFLLLLPQVLILPDAFFAGQALGRSMTPQEASAFLDEFQRQTWAFLAVTVIETLVFAPFISAVIYRLAFDFLDGRPANPFGGDPIGTGLRLVGASLIVFAVMAGFSVAGVLIVALLVTSGAGIFVLLLLPILLVLGAIVLLRLLPVTPLVAQGMGAIEGVRHGWSMTEGHVLRIFRWTLVIGLISLVGGVAAQLVQQVGALVMPVRVAYLLSGLVQGPLQVLSAVVLTLLVRLLQHGPSVEVPARSTAPDWGAPPPPPV